MNIFRVFAKKSRKGFTLMETMVTVGIVAILCAIAIPAIVSVNRSLSFRDLDNSARSVYLAAQSNLAQMRSSGDLAALAKMTELDGAKAVPQRDNAGLAEGDWSEDLRYTVSGTKAFDLLLPANTVDSQLRSNSMLIEYNPVTGHVYSVFYREGDEPLSYGDLSREEETRKTLELGYYCGGSVTIAAAEENSTEVTLTAEDGQELILTLKVPVPESYTEHQDVFYENISAKILIRGESSGAEFVIPTDALTLEKELCIGSPNYIAFTYVMDSLNEAYGLTALNNAMAQGDKKFIPGEDLSFEATVLFDAPEGYTLLRYDNVLLTGVNSLFSRVTKTGEGDAVTYTIEIANGRHLQNLNKLNEDIAKKVTGITLTKDIDWSETADYYADAYTRSRTANAVDYTRFTPIATAKFEKLESFDGQKNKILYLDINVSGSENKIAGLFETCKFSVKDLALVSPTVKGGTAAGALAGTAETGASFENCSVYIDTEAKGFSRDMLENCGVSGKTAGGLVGSVSGAENSAIEFTNCFAAVNVTGSDTAGGLVGAAKNATFSQCYASGNVTGGTAGGFVGTSEKSAYTQCFASGNVTGQKSAGGFVGKLGNRVSGLTFSECYAVGVVDGKQEGEQKATTDGFCGTGLTLPTEAENKTDYFKEKVYKNTYFWNHEADGATSLCAEAVGYAELMSYNASANDNNKMWEQTWQNVSGEKTHAYSLNVQGSYPFVVYGDIEYYGDWPELKGPVVLAYYEKYQDDNNTETEEIGYYISSEKSSTLQNDRVILEDGYVLLAQSDSVSINDTNSTLTKWDNINFNGYNVYKFSVGGANNGFYTSVKVSVPGTGSDSKEYTFYYNPDFALTQINPVYNADGMVKENTTKPSGVPGKICIRTARHLAELMGNTDYQGSGYHYVQMVNVDFTTYDTESIRQSAQMMTDFAGTYTGSGGYVSQAKITIGTGARLFNTVSGTVKDIQVCYTDKSPAGNLLANTVSGTMENCDVTVSTTGTQAVQAEESGEETAAQNESEAAQKTPTGGVIGTVSENGKVTDCDVIAATLTGANAGFVGVNRGNIARCTVAPAEDEKESGKTGGVSFGFAAENAGTIKNSMANTAATAAAFAGKNTGVIRDCYAWYAGTSETSGMETKIVFAETDEGEIITSYAAIYGDTAYALVYDRAGVASFRDTWSNTSVPLGGNWYYYREAGGSYPYCVPDGITHRGGWVEFGTPIAHTGYYYYEKYDKGLGLYIVILDDPKTEDDEGKTVSTLEDEKTITETGYGIFTMKSGTAEMAWETMALTLDSAPIVPTAVDKTSEENLTKEFKVALKIEENENVSFEFKKLSANSVYVLNETEINTWFAPKTAAGAYTIRTGEQFAAVEEFAGADFVQTRDITVTAPLSGFAGEYDGGEHCIVYKGNGMSHGLFGDLTGTVKYVTLKNAKLNITLDGTNGEETTKDSTPIVQDSVTAGVLADTAGENARILHCRVVKPVITVTESAQVGKNLAIEATLGGLVGENQGSIKVCSVENLRVYYTEAVIEENHKKNTTYTANYTLGGLVGRMTAGWMSESFATGEMGGSDEYSLFAKADGETVILGGAIGGEDAEKRATYVDCYAAVDIHADNATVGSFAGEVHGGTFWACAGWSGDDAWAGITENIASLTKCYYYNSVNGGYEVMVMEMTDGKLNEEKVEKCADVSDLVAHLNGDDETVWSGKTTYVNDEGKEGETYNTLYPVLKGRYDELARVDEATPIFIQPETVAAEEPTAEEENAPSEDMTAPEVTMEPEETATPETTPDVTAEPEETATPEPTAEPEETAAPEITAEPEPVPDETAGEETPEPAAEAPAGEEGERNAA